MWTETSRYPTELIDVWWIAGGARVLVRPVLPQDGTQCQAFVRALSAQSRYQRFLTAVQELPHALLDGLTRVDHRAHVALIAEIRVDGRTLQIAEARYARDADEDSCEFAIAVADEWQGRGIGRRLLEVLLRHARAAGIRAFRGEVLAYNQPMLALASAVGMRVRTHPGDARLMIVEARTDTLADPEEMVIPPPARHVGHGTVLRAAAS